MLAGHAVDPRDFASIAAIVIAGATLLAFLRPRLVVRGAVPVLLVTALVSLASLTTLLKLDPPGLRLRIDPSAEPLLPAHDPGRAAYDEAVRDFGDDEVYVVAIVAKDVFRSAVLDTLRRIGDRVRRLPNVRDVTSLADVTSVRWVAAEDWIEVRPLIEEIPTAVAELAALRERTLADESYRRTIVSEDGTTAAIDVAFRNMTDGELIAQDLDRRIAQIVAEELPAGTHAHVAGRPHAKSRVFHLVRRDLMRLVPIAVCVMGAVLLLVAGRFSALVLSVGVALVAVLWTFGAMALLDRPLTILTTLLGPNLIVIASVYGVHFLARFDEDAQAAASPEAAALACLEHVRTPVIVSGTTTMIGFGSLLVSDVPAVFELGALSLFGVACTTLLALTALPAAAALMPLPDRVGVRRHAVGRVFAAAARVVGAAEERALLAIESWAVHHARRVVIVAGICVVLAIVAIPFMQIDTDYISFFPERSRVRRDFAAVNERLAGAIPLYVTFDGAGPGTFREPAALAVVEAVQQRLDDVPGVTHTASVVDRLRRLNRAVEADDPAAYRLPDTRGGVAELIQFVPKLDLARLLTVDQARANLVVRTGEVGSSAVLGLVDRIESVLRSGVVPPDLRAAVTGNAILLSRSADAIARQQTQSVGLATFAIFGLVWWGLRSWRLGIVAMLPNVIPVLLFFGLLGAGLAPLSLPTSLVASMALGISIDDTMHLLARWKAEREAGADPEEATRRACRTVGRGVLTASVMLSAGFAVVALSGFATLRQFGLLSAATMVICLANDALLLPALLVGGGFSAPRAFASRRSNPGASRSASDSRS